MVLCFWLFSNKSFFIPGEVKIKDDCDDGGQGQEANYGVRQSWISLLWFILVGDIINNLRSHEQ